MEINKYIKGNLIKFKNKYATIIEQLNYNEYMINCSNKVVVANILDISPVDLKDTELKSLGFQKGDKKKIKNKEYTSWTSLFEKEYITIIVNLDEKVSLDDLAGIENNVPENYRYVHQVQNLMSYMINDIVYFQK